MSLLSAILDSTGRGEKLSPQITTSKNYKHWISAEDLKRCVECKNNHGKIWYIEETPSPASPAHFNCRCEIKLMEAITAGTATINGTDGADWTLKYTGKLPAYYVDKSEALQKGWEPSKWPSNFIPEQMIAAGIYKNRNNHLPQEPGRIWYEADINYQYGKRNTQRIVWSNDGLIFVTYDHYETFCEIV